MTSAQPPPYAELTNALRGLLQAIGGNASDRAGGERLDLEAALARVDRLGAALGADAPPQLRHFLQRRSYQKALEFLRGLDGQPA